jgi:hypothetical protein
MLLLPNRPAGQLNLTPPLHQYPASHTLWFTNTRSPRTTADTA